MLVYESVLYNLCKCLPGFLWGAFYGINNVYTVFRASFRVRGATMRGAFSRISWVLAGPLNPKP